MSATGATAAARRPHAAPGTLLPLLIHTALLYRSVFARGQMYLGVGNSVSVIIWLTVLIYWVGGFFYRLEGLQVLIAGAACGAGVVAARCFLPCARSPTPICRVFRAAPGHLTAGL